MASKPLPAARNTSENSSSQWKNRVSAATRPATVRVSADGSAKVLGSGACSIWSAGQNQQAHHRSIASFSARHAADPTSSSRVQACPFGRVVHRHGVHALQHREGVVVGRGGLREQVGLEQVGAPEEVLEVGSQLRLDEILDCLRARALREVDAVRVVPVAALAVLPGHHGVVPELVEPGADEGVAALDLVVEEAEGQSTVHGLDPQRQAAQSTASGSRSTA